MESADPFGKNWSFNPRQLGVLETVLTVLPIETDDVTGWLPQTKRSVHNDLIDQVSLLGGSIERPDHESFYQAFEDVFAIMATSGPALYGNIVITRGARGVKV